MTKTIRLGWAAMAAALLLFGGATAAQAQLTVLNCGPTIRNLAKTNYPNMTTSATTFTNIPQAAVTVNVPSGEQRCVKIRFSAFARCYHAGGGPIIDNCYIRMIVEGSSLPAPPVNGFSFASEDLIVHSFEWIKMLDPGSHIIRPQTMVGNAATTFHIGSWVLSVDVSEP
jgi:hypothetical protein